MKRLHFLRHGQAAHNVRAEQMRTLGCTFQEFLDTMAQDDAFDAPLTQLGLEQAHEQQVRARDLEVDMIVASPLSRAIDTAEIVFPGASCRRVIREEWREVNGMLLNAQRLSRTELSRKYPLWSELTLDMDDDGLWSPQLETTAACAERAYNGLCWLWEANEANIAIAAHGGIFSYLLNEHECVTASPSLRHRFHNCEIRSCTLTCVVASADDRLHFELRACEGESVGDAILSGRQT